MSRHHHHAFRLLALFVVLLVAACGTWVGNPKPGGDSKTDQPSTPSGGTVSANMIVQADGAAFNLATGETSSNSAAQLLSLKYVIGSIMLCESADTAGGFGFENTSGCMDIYHGYVCDGSASCTPTPAEVAAGKYASSQLDLMKAADRSKIASPMPFKKDNVHKYNWAIMTWSSPIAVTGSVSLGDGMTTFTKPGIDYAPFQPGSAGPVTKTGVDMTVGPPEEVVVQSANGGAAFKFQTPFVITDDDFTNKTAFTIDLAFNPANILTASRASGSRGTIQSTAGPAVSMFLPMLQLLPVPRRASEVTKKEVYSVAIEPGRTLRIELYFKDGDPARSIYGAGALMVLDPAVVSSGQQIDTFRVTDITTNADGSLKINNNASGVVADGLKRRTNGILTSIGSEAKATSTTPAYTYLGEFLVH